MILNLTGTEKITIEPEDGKMSEYSKVTIDNMVFSVDNVDKYIGKLIIPKCKFIEDFDVFVNINNDSVLWQIEMPDVNYEELINNAKGELL